MARPLRIDLAGGLYHVTARGDRQEDIYVDDVDRTAWLALFERVCERFNWRCHAYCQMTNHYHFVVETPDANLSKGMRQLNGVYTQQFNRRHGLVGHLFQGRFKGILVERETHLSELGRYVVLNPVRAGMVADAGAWPWSSYKAMIGTVETPPWLETDWLLGQFGRSRKAARARFQDFVRAGVGQPPIWEQLRHQLFLGSDAFIQQVADRQTTIDADLHEIKPAHRRALAKPLAHYETACADRREAMARAYLSGGYNLREIAGHFAVHYATVSRAVRWFEQQPKRDSRAERSKT
jgi:REP element-mobilizing transposase RayT